MKMNEDEPRGSKLTYQSTNTNPIRSSLFPLLFPVLPFPLPLPSPLSSSLFTNQQCQNHLPAPKHQPAANESSKASSRNPYTAPPKPSPNKHPLSALSHLQPPRPVPAHDEATQHRTTHPTIPSKSSRSRRPRSIERTSTS